jgi:hypothetical protein
MAYGIQINDSSGSVILDSDDYTFRYVTSTTFTNNPTTAVVVSVSGIAAGTHFATCSTGFPVVETNQVRIHPQFGSGTGTITLYIFRI